ncbi:hypothetical protein PC118_g16226 [Phytophthora cactorum]|uniref:Uncharacterized protein n=2 Tax=Phytophthora cactorum TaxID=29920 RepID=A0A8T1FGT7_9STRA|nr:hypothetical protein PC118_g16226 [Phytophthora cactorum]
MSEAGGLSTLDEEVTDTSLPTTSVSSHARRRACYTFHDLVPRDGKETCILRRGLKLDFTAAWQQFPDYTSCRRHLVPVWRGALAVRVVTHGQRAISGGGAMVFDVVEGFSLLASKMRITLESQDKLINMQPFKLRALKSYRSIKASIPSKLKKLEDGWLDWKDDLVSSAKYWRVQRVHSTTMLAAGLNGTRPSYYKRMHHQLLPAA